MANNDMNESHEKDAANAEGNDLMKVYEIGYHIVPIVAEEHVAAEVGNIKGLIESRGGLFISDDFPKRRSLAYSISKNVSGRRHDFEEAYFGWVKFEIDPAEIPAITKAVEGNENVLRHILVQTVRESTMSIVKPAYRKEGGEDGEGTAAKPEQTKEITAEDEAKISQSIDDLVKE